MTVLYSERDLSSITEAMAALEAEAEAIMDMVGRRSEQQNQARQQQVNVPLLYLHIHLSCTLQILTALQSVMMTELYWLVMIILYLSSKKYWTGKCRDIFITPTNIWCQTHNAYSDCTLSVNIDRIPAAAVPPRTSQLSRHKRDNRPTTHPQLMPTPTLQWM